MDKKNTEEIFEKLLAFGPDWELKISTCSAMAPPLSWS